MSRLVPRHGLEQLNRARHRERQDEPVRLRQGQRPLDGGEGGAALAEFAVREMTPLTPEELADPVHPYVRVHPDGTVVAYSNQTEMGQGAHTTLALIVAEELDADFAAVRVISAANGVGPQGDVYGTPAGGGFIQPAATPWTCAATC